MTSFFDLYVYAKASAAEHPVLAVLFVLFSAAFLLPPLALASFLASPVLVPVTLLVVVRHRGHRHMLWMLNCATKPARLMPC